MQQQSKDNHRLTLCELRGEVTSSAAVTRILDQCLAECRLLSADCLLLFIIPLMPPPRILAIDYGSRRMGLAVSDALGITAQGIDTLERKNKRSDFARLERVLREYEIKEIVLGNPLRMSGEEGRQSDKVALFAEELRKKFQLPVHLFDERLTSAEANRLLREADVSLERRVKAVDRMAAILILQAFLQSRES